MKQAIVFGVALGILASAPPLVIAQEAGATDARSQLEARKKEQAEKFDAQERACSQSFAVNDCISEVNIRRRAVQAALRQEENTLNDLDRRQRERQRLQSLQEKARQREEQAPRVDPEAESEQDRLRRQQDKQAQHAPQAAPGGQSEPKLQNALDQKSLEQNAAAYAARQKAAIERRANRDRKLKEQGKVTADLPTPP